MTAIALAILMETWYLFPRIKTESLYGRGISFITRGKAMQRRLVALLIVVVAVAGVFATSGCERAKASGKLQIMYSGNIRGNVAPCG
jgi:hypothetical protein